MEIKKVGNGYIVRENLGYGVSERGLRQGDFLSCKILDITLANFTINPLPHKPEAKETLTIEMNKTLSDLLGVVRVGDFVDIEIAFKNGHPSKYLILGKSSNHE